MPWRPPSEDPEWEETAEAALARAEVEAEEDAERRGRLRDEALLREVESGSDPKAEGRRAAQRLWAEVQAILRGGSI